MAHWGAVRQKEEIYIYIYIYIYCSINTSNLKWGRELVKVELFCCVWAGIAQ